MLRRRDLLATAAWLAVTGVTAHARMISGALPWSPNAGDPPIPARPGPWLFFTAAEVRPSRHSPIASSRLIRKHLAARTRAARSISTGNSPEGMGKGDGLYNRPPFMKGSKQQGPQSEGGVTKTYRDGLAALDKYCRANYSGKAFAELPDADKDELLKGLESEKIKLGWRGRQGVLPRRPSPTSRWASSPTRSTAATATWCRGK